VDEVGDVDRFGRFPDFGVFGVADAHFAFQGAVRAWIVMLFKRYCCGLVWFGLAVWRCYRMQVKDER
jgi:hypothetical protein